MNTVHEVGAEFTDCDTLSRTQFIPEKPSATRHFTTQSETNVHDMVCAVIENSELQPRVHISNPEILDAQQADDLCTRVTRIRAVIDNPGAKHQMRDKHMAQRCHLNNGILLSKT